MLLASVASAGRYECTAVANIAKLGAHDDRSVAVTEDTDEDECRFSVDGAPVDSPPAGDVLAGLAAIADRSMVSLLNNNEVHSLAFALIAASQHDRPESELLDALNESLVSISKCFQILAEGESTPPLDNDVMTCFVGDSWDGPVPLRTDNPLIVQIFVPHLQIAVQTSGERHYLFFPRSLIGSNRFQRQ